MLAGPDCVRLSEKFKSVHKLLATTTGHHKETHSLQSRFLKDVQSFTKLVTRLDNPFLTTGRMLISLDTRDMMEHEAAVSLSQIHKVGQALHEEYVKNTARQGDGSVVRCYKEK